VTVNKGMLVGLMSLGHELELSGLLVCAVRVELSEVVTSIGPRVKKGLETERF
jgi:hypothetical protein